MTRVSALIAAIVVTTPIAFAILSQAAQIFA
jgi:hypothetical protein